ncbi:phage protease [Azonexus sp.]|uniref:phage protease n=1 Tax=Azonexus sp. TaxID=1872668 RepID=UPI0035B2FE31
MVSTATFSQDLVSPKKEFRIIPCGIFRAWDGRPLGLPGWKMDANIANQVIADLAARDDLVIDYEHQTLLSRNNGLPAPAAGWCSRLAWREGDGLFAQDVKWTDRAKAMLSSGEYRYISPVFTFNPITGQVERLLSIGLTNNPGLVRLTDMSRLAANSGELQTTPRESDRSVETFNRVFGEFGVTYPEAPNLPVPDASSPPSLPAGMSARDRAVMHHVFPGVWDPDK